MKRIIDGKGYDTETATEVYGYWNGLSTSDFKNVTESLYRTPRGNWFLAGKGGALSKYAQSCGNNSYCGGSGLSPLLAEEAKQWLQDKSATEPLEQYFGAEIQDA